MKRKSVLSQISEIKSYKNGWFENSNFQGIEVGKVFDSLSLDALADIFSIPFFDSYIPYLYPTTDNKISVEWGFFNDPDIICLEVDLTTYIGYYSSYNTYTYQAYETQINLLTELYVLCDLLKRASIQPNEYIK